jgi:hypothetical protein
MVGIVLANGLKFRRDAERPNLLVSLKTEDSKENCGYCFDCYTPIPMPSGQCPNKLAVIQRHQCKTFKERPKRPATGVTVAPPAPTSKLSEDDLKEFKKLLDFDIELTEDLTVDFKKSRSNMMTAMRNASTAMKSSTSPAASWRGIADKISDALPAKFSTPLRQRISDSLEHLRELMYDSDDDDGEGVDEESDIRDTLLAVIKIAMEPKQTTDLSSQVKELSSHVNGLSSRVKELEDEIELKTVTMSDLVASERVAAQTAMSNYRALLEAEARIRELESQMREQADKISHTE